ncbi:cilia- and flagella-associated protein 300 isoform X2 [Syngnathus scovelli]|uniref:cilia- and flagella-associated protein 300 isoform X2 n=1 Tax=Syngnathus scovelli TaxID=161590 RepID=UPI002110E5AA|nr:cilia- and flagella-associated protein 300 [Syngnathus scovelli]XP_049603424.1 cilia- and flagella-associated protein 300 [Syngnathus scovelli]
MRIMDGRPGTAMSGDNNDLERTFSFRSVPSRKFAFLEEKETVALLMKWSMLGRLSAQTFSFDQKFHLYDSDRFALCFFKDASVLSSVKMMDGWQPFDRPVASVDVEVVPSTKVSMDLFDPIYTCGIVASSGHIARCFHEVYPDYDKLREMLQDEESDNYHILGSAERAEFLFRLFKHLCLGGELNQYEDTIEPYINVTKKIYKELISVQKDPETKRIAVVSMVLKVHVYDESGRCYPGSRDEEQTFAYLIVDPFKRHVTLLCHSYGVGTMSL